ncbi:pyruvate:ferredoxin (flavodoxin) oxidoreductase [Thioflexithrix psekupsensis]|uniref:Pyruvate-flavodoxin oxidoreductase n=1 Tax=Thioflexithrix psekupsensis TaxID=1570016 RepID=A0A251X498_9GAMM|nr:pyruvate:ferredoxin (flavodoxin) oxidoreductase [Thioflexithrix psekupsensis]OUD12314.1 pyruvate:ferredoxin (flavodoxin) oxidoreductase [Thioflexithrix psekupsensis]
MSEYVTLDGNEAAAYVAYRVNEVCAIYPITPSSPMAEFADQWAAEGQTNLWGNIPLIIEMQSEAGAAGTVHGALQTGALTTTFTASQGLMLMIPNLYKIAGELTSAVFQVAARSLAAQGLSIFGDHSDVMAVKNTGFALLASASVQEAHDLALIAQATTLEARIPFLHFFDGFRTSHEVNKIELIDDQVLRAMIDDELVYAHRARGLNPDRPVMRGTAQNPDIYFQARETVNPFYTAVPKILQKAMDQFAELTGRQYHLFEYEGDLQAERIVIIMGSGASTVKQTVRWLQQRGEKVGVIQVRLYLPFDSESFLALLPETVTHIAVLDRCKTPGATGEPLYQDIVVTLSSAFSTGKRASLPKICGGRYGLSSKEFTPAMVKAIFDELTQVSPKNPFTIGIEDDIGHTSLSFDPDFNIEPDNVIRAMFFGLGADGTVGANKNSIKIIGEDPAFYAQGYFVYDSKKSGSQTVSHLRFGPEPIDMPYLIQSANFIACHQFNFILKQNVLERAAKNAIVLLNSPYSASEVWAQLPQTIQRIIVQRALKLYVIDASKVARSIGMGNRTNTIMQTCFFALSGVMPREQAIEKIKHAIEKSYGKKGDEVVKSNFAAVDETLVNLHEVSIPESLNSGFDLPSIVPDFAPEFVRTVTAKMMAGKGDELPVSLLPIDGTYPTGTTQWEKRNISPYVPQWEADICIQCGNCSFVCPHSVIRAKFYNETHLDHAPNDFRSAPISARGFPATRYTLQIYVEDCTGCGLCVDACPAQSLKRSGMKAINMREKEPILQREKENIRFFESIPINDRSQVNFSSVRGTQFLQPLFEFSGACAGCGETPYVRLLSQLFGDRLLVANATGCSSIYGGNLPTTPWTKNEEGRGPAWSNSLFEDNAEFGLGFRLAADKHLEVAQGLLEQLKPALNAALVEDLLSAQQITEFEIRQQRQRVEVLKQELNRLKTPLSAALLSVVDHLVRRSVWLVGGDGWAYDIGSGGLDHVLASGRDVNILVLDTEVYSNTGGQMSKSTPLGAVAKFAAAGKTVGKKDLALQAISYGNVYVARIAMGANPQQTLLALREAEAYSGPSLILSYSHCIAHGINMQHGLRQQQLAVASGYWPLMRYNPQLRATDHNPFVLDSPRPRIDFKDYAYNELRYKMLVRSNPVEAARLLSLAQAVVKQKWAIYEEMATRDGSHFHPDARRVDAQTIDAIKA